MLSSFITYSMIDHSLDLMFDRILSITQPIPHTIRSPKARIDHLICKWMPVIISDSYPSVPYNQWGILAQSLETQKKYNSYNYQYYPHVTDYFLPIIRFSFGNWQPLRMHEYSPILKYETSAIVDKKYECDVRFNAILENVYQKIKQNKGIIAGLHFRQTESNLLIYW